MKIGPGAHPKFVQVDPPLDKKSVWVRHLISTQVAKVNYGMFQPTFTFEKCKNLYESGATRSTLFSISVQRVPTILFLWKYANTSSKIYISILLSPTTKDYVSWTIDKCDQRLSTLDQFRMIWVLNKYMMYLIPIGNLSVPITYNHAGVCHRPLP